MSRNVCGFARFVFRFVCELWEFERMIFGFVPGCVLVSEAIAMSSRDTDECWVYGKDC